MSGILSLLAQISWLMVAEMNAAEPARGLVTGHAMVPAQAVAVEVLDTNKRCERYEEKSSTIFTDNLRNS